MIISNKFKPFFELLDPSFDEKHDKIRYVILIGGRGGAKSHALGTWQNSASYKEGWGLFVTRWTMTSAETSVIPEFGKVCEGLGNIGDFTFKRTQVVNNKSGVITDYRGLKPQSNQSSGSNKSLSKKNIFIVEEAEDVADFELFDKTDNSIRTIDHKNLIILCLNQGSVNHWIFKEFFSEKRDDVMVIETTYLDNLKYLDEGFIRKAERVKARDLKRYNHVYLNDWKTDTDGALWRQADIDLSRIQKDEFDIDLMTEIVVAYDPAVTDSKAGDSHDKKPDEDGIEVMGKDSLDHIYLIEEASKHGTRIEIAKSLVALYHKYNASWIIIEKNNGGDFIPALIKTVDKYVRCKTVTATKGKRLRAEPIQARYELGEIHHVGHFTELEYEMTTWVPDTGMASPNRIDAMVWGGTHLSNKKKQVKIF